MYEPNLERQATNQSLNRQLSSTSASHGSEKVHVAMRVQFIANSSTVWTFCDAA
jgi:hypothetical protein